MVTLSGGVAQNANISPMEAFLQQYGGNIAAASQGLPTFNLGLSYSAPIAQPPIQAPVLPVQTSSPAPENINVEYSPVQQSSSNLQLAPIQFPDMPAFNPTGPATIQVGGRQYPADSVIAQAVPSFAPGRKVDLGDAMVPVYDGANLVGYRKGASQQLTAGVPQMDTLSDAGAGYQATALPDTSNSQVVNLGTGQETLPNNFYGMPNPYMQRPVAPNYSATPEYAAAMDLPNRAMQALPSFGDYYQPAPPPPLDSNPVNWLKRAVYTSPGAARARSAQYSAAAQMYNNDAQRIANIMATTTPGLISLNREGIQQKGADYRTNLNAWNQGAQALLGFYLDQEEKKKLSVAQSLDMAARAYLMPSVIDGQPNREKVMMLREAGKFLGWSEQDIGVLSRQQDPQVAEQMKQASLETSKSAFELKKATSMLDGELAMLAANIAQTNAQAGLMGSQASTNAFNLAQRKAIAKYDRMGQIADAMAKVDALLVNKETRQNRIDNAKLQNEKLQADIFRQQMEANGVPVELAARMSASMASMGQSVDPNVRAAGANMADSMFGLLGIKEKLEPVMKGATIQGYRKVPVNTPSTINNFQQNMPSYRRNMQAPAPLPPAYFSGAPLANGGDSRGVGNFLQGQE